MAADLAPENWNAERLYQTYKPYLMAVAYRMLGSVSDAEDVVQDLFVSLQAPSAEPIRSPKAYLSKLVTNRCLNVLKSAKRKKETYLGIWLPEPLLQAEGTDPLDAVERSETISYAFMLLLESLTPAERAVYVLREAFDTDYRDIAEFMGKSEANCRKIYSRAKKKIEGAAAEGRGRIGFGTEERLVARFVDAFRTGAIPELLKLLADDAVFFSDGGGVVRAAIRPIYTRPRVATMLQVLADNKLKDAEVHEMTVNGSKGLLFVRNGIVLATVSFDWSPDTYEIRRIYTVLNPEKLKHLRVP